MSSLSPSPQPCVVQELLQWIRSQGAASISPQFLGQESYSRPAKQPVSISGSHFPVPVLSDAYSEGGDSSLVVTFV